MGSMSWEEREEVRKSMEVIEGNYVFGESKYKAVKRIRIPCTFFRWDFFLITDVVQGDIPWLLGRESLRKMRACINLNSYEMTIGVFKNARVPLRVDEKGHLRISIRRGIKKEIWWEGNVKNSLEDKQERKKILKRLHVQFGHPSKERLGDLIKDAYRDEMEDETLRDIKEDIGELSDNCEVCIRYKKNT